MALLAAAALAISSAPLSAQPADPPSLAYVESGHSRISIEVTAGVDGAPAGFMVQWMTLADYAANGSAWPSIGSPNLNYAEYTGTPTLNTNGGAYTTFLLGPNESIIVQVGDIFDETGVLASTTDELASGTDYVFSAFINSASIMDESALSSNVLASTSDDDCVFTIGRWKNRPEEWPVSSLTLGAISYTAAELMSILNQPAQGNGLVFLAHQLIAAKLNIANGSNPAPIQATIDAADALIGGLVVPPVGSGYIAPANASPLNDILDDYNNGLIPGSCDPPPPPPSATERSSWGELKGQYR